MRAPMNPANPLRNIKVLAPGFLATHELLPFHPWFVRQLTRYSTLRFMDWQRTNDIHGDRRSATAREGVWAEEQHTDHVHGVWEDRNGKSIKAKGCQR